MSNVCKACGKRYCAGGWDVSLCDAYTEAMEESHAHFTHCAVAELLDKVASGRANVKSEVRKFMSDISVSRGQWISACAERLFFDQSPTTTTLLPSCSHLDVAQYTHELAARVNEYGSFVSGADWRGDDRFYYAHEPFVEARLSGYSVQGNAIEMRRGGFVQVVNA